MLRLIGQTIRLPASWSWRQRFSLGNCSLGSGVPASCSDNLVLARDLGCASRFVLGHNAILYVNNVVRTTAYMVSCAYVTPQRDYR